MKLHYKTFSTPRSMLQTKVLRIVVKFINSCEFSKLFYGELNRAEYGWLKHILNRIEFMLVNCPDFGGDMKKCLIGYEKLLPQIKKLLS